MINFKSPSYSAIFITFILYSLLPSNLIASETDGSVSAISVSAVNGMVVSDHALASQIGLNILKKGGNAIDAAIAVGYALAVVQPCCGNIGGGGFMLIHLADGQDIFLNFREKAPLKASKDMYLDKEGEIQNELSTRGYLAVGVPGTVMGFDTALKKYGTLSLKEVIAAAIQLAEEGFLLAEGDIKILSDYTADFARNKNVADIFLKNGKPYQVGDRLIQKDLAKTLQQIAENGTNAFYDGPISQAIIKASNQSGGILSEEDFKRYHTEYDKPLECQYRGYQVVSAPLPSSGGIMLCQMLSELEKVPLSKMAYHSAASTDAITRAMSDAFSKRSTMGNQKITPKSNENHNTTHYSIIDKAGNAVAVTYTLNSLFGAKVIAGNTGFFLNNEMDDFTTKIGGQNQFNLVQSSANQIEAEKQPLSSMSPTILKYQGKPFLVLGAAGGPRIITTNLQTIINVIDYQLPIQDAVNRPRFHHQYIPNVITAEKEAFKPEVIQKLKEMGHKIVVDNHLSVEEALLIDPKTHIIYGGVDHRRSAGAALGY